MTKQYPALRITDKATHHVSATDTYVTQIVIACTNAGSAWTLAIQDKSSPNPLVFVSMTLTLPTDGLPLKIFFDEPVFFKGGVDIVTAGTTAGIVVVAGCGLVADQ